MSWSSGLSEIYGLLCEFIAPRPQEEKLDYYFQSGACLGALETHVLLSFLWLIFCKWHVINVTLQKLKIAVHKEKNIFYNKIHEII